jgi:hypothetical protein
MHTYVEGIQGETADVRIEQALRILASPGSVHAMQTEALNTIESDCVSITAELTLLGESTRELREQITILSRDRGQLSTPKGRNLLRALIQSARVKTFMFDEGL